MDLDMFVSAPVDLTGYWVSLITEDWRFRMVTPPKGRLLVGPTGLLVGPTERPWPATGRHVGSGTRRGGGGGLQGIPVRRRASRRREVSRS